MTKTNLQYLLPTHRLTYTYVTEGRCMHSPVWTGEEVSYRQSLKTFWYSRSDR
jgi:hypothetical protein